VLWWFVRPSVSRLLSEVGVYQNGYYTQDRAKNVLWQPRTDHHSTCRAVTMTAQDSSFLVLVISANHQSTRVSKKHRTSMFFFQRSRSTHLICWWLLFTDAKRTSVRPWTARVRPLPVSFSVWLQNAYSHSFWLIDWYLFIYLMPQVTNVNSVKTNVKNKLLHLLNETAWYKWFLGCKIW